MSQYFQLLPDYTAIQTVVSLFHIDKLQHDVYLPEQNESELIQRFQSHTNLFETYYKHYPFKQLFMTLSLKRCITILRHFLSVVNYGLLKEKTGYRLIDIDFIKRSQRVTVTFD